MVLCLGEELYSKVEILLRIILFQLLRIPHTLLFSHVPIYTLSFYLATTVFAGYILFMLLIFKSQKGPIEALNYNQIASNFTP